MLPSICCLNIWKELVMANMLESAEPAPSLMEVRIFAVCLEAFAGFMRYDELEVC